MKLLLCLKNTSYIVMSIADFVAYTPWQSQREYSCCLRIIIIFKIFFLLSFLTSIVHYFALFALKHLPCYIISSVLELRYPCSLY